LYKLYWKGSGEVMKLLNKLERRFGRYAIPNLMKYVVILFVIGLIIGSFFPLVYIKYMLLDFNMVAQGQVWRLITWIIPFDTIGNILFFAISVYFYYLIGNSLEQNWGAFRMNLYFFSGIIFNILASFITYLITGSSILSTSSFGLICSTMFFAFAALYPNMTFYIYFLIPVKAKYLAILEGGVYLFDIYQYIAGKQYLFIVPLVVAFANFLIFFFATRNYHRLSPNEFKRKANYRRQMNEAKNQGNVVNFKGQNVITRHKCAVCGRTELDGDNLEFRFCSKCDGNYEYCMDHLFTHEHVKK
jgi:hypothetical protein